MIKLEDIVVWKLRSGETIISSANEPKRIETIKTHKQNMRLKMKNYCENCKWNSYNMEVKRLKSMNFIKRFLVLTFMEWRINIKRNYPECCHPEVFCLMENFVFKEKSIEKMFCKIARTCPTSTWKTCGEEGKYFEENE